MSLRVAAFVPHPPSGASSRYRVYDLVPRLATLGIKVSVYPYFDEAGYARLYREGGVTSKLVALTRGGARRWRDLGATRADVALVHREVWPLVGGGGVSRLRRHHPRWVFDFDDAVWIPNVSEANRVFARLKPFEQPARLTEGASAVSAGNAWLAAWARGRRAGRPAEDVGTVPTSVDVSRWTPRPRSGSAPRLVWIGTHSTVAYLEEWAPAIARLAARTPGLELHLIGAKLEIPGVRVIPHAWSRETEVELVASGDVGLAPLPDTEWAKGKCGSKLLLYMALGLPAVASPIGVHDEIVQDGESGVLASTPKAVEEALERLLGDRAWREQLGRAARARVESAFSSAVVAPRLAALLRRAAESR